MLTRVTLLLFEALSEIERVRWGTERWPRKLQCQSLIMVFLSYKKRRESGNTGRSVDIFPWTWNVWGGRTWNTSKQRKWLIRVFIVEMTLMLFEPFFVLVSMLQSLLRHLKNHYRWKGLYRKCSLCIIVCIAIRYQ